MEAESWLGSTSKAGQNVSLVAQHPCSSIDTEVHFELKVGGEASSRG
jgi:hypothetical protein